MAMTKEKGLGIPPDRLVRRAIGISPDRDQYFNDIIRKFKEKFPSLKIIYANDRMGAVINQNKPSPDFVLIATGQLISSDPSLPPKNIVIMDAPMVFTERSIAGWTIAVEEGMMDNYFQYMLDKALRIDTSKFYEFIEFMAKLSRDPNDPRYWKRPENEDKLTTELMELYARYTRKGDHKMSDMKGYGK